jgi:hypothetical protein
MARLLYTTGTGKVKYTNNLVTAGLIVEARY